MNSKSIAAIVMTTVLATGYGTIHAVGQHSYGWSNGNPIASDYSVGIGNSIFVYGDDDAVVGTVSSTANDKGTSIGSYAGVDSYIGSTNLGYNAYGHAFNAISLGRASLLYGYQPIGIGYRTKVSYGVQNGVAIGEWSRANDDNSLALGSHAATNRSEGNIGYDPSHIAVVKDLKKGDLQLPTELQEKIKAKEVEYNALQNEHDMIQTELYGLSKKREKLVDELGWNIAIDPAELNTIKTQSEETYNRLKKKDAELVAKKAEINQIAGTWRSGQGAISIGNSTGDPTELIKLAAGTKDIRELIELAAKTKDTRQLIGLAAGTEDTDGVNVAQLKSLDLATHRALDRTVRQLRNEARQGNTMTAALAGLKPVAYKAKEPTQVLASVGQYTGHSGYALGVAHYRNERMMVNAGAALSGNQLVYNAGATLRLGKKRASLAVDRDHLSVESLFEALQGEQTRNQRQKQVIRELELENQQLHQDVEQLKRMVRP